jgi:hypothetical protein
MNPYIDRINRMITVSIDTMIADLSFFAGIRVIKKAANRGIMIKYGSIILKAS